MINTKTISNSESKEDMSAPVAPEWREFTFNGVGCDNWPIFVGIDKAGNIWLRPQNISDAVNFESGGALDEAAFNELVCKLPDSMSRKVHWRLPQVQNGQFYKYIPAITPNGLFKVTQALLRSQQPEQVKKAVRRI